MDLSDSNDETTSNSLNKEPGTGYAAFLKVGEKISLDENLLKESKEIVEDLIVAAHNDAKSKLKKKTSEEISKVTGGVSLPPGFKLPF